MAEIKAGETTTKSAKSARFGVVDFLIAVLLPVLGVAWAILQLVKRRYQRGSILLIVSVFALALYIYLFFLFELADRWFR